MELRIKKEVVVKATTLQINAKVRDSGCYTMLDQDGEEIVDHDGYVPDFMPGDHYGDYLMLDIDMATGKIKNWDQISPTDVSEWVSKTRDGEE